VGIRMEEHTDFIREELDRQIEEFRRRRKEYKRKSIAVRVAIAILAACSTILIGIQGVGEWFRTWLQNLALVFTAMVTLLTSLEAFFNHRSLYVRYTATTIQLYMLRSEFEYLLSKSGPSVRPEDFDRIYGKLTEILDQTSSEWLAARKELRAVGS
jgi:hypothetical protein